MGGSEAVGDRSRLPEAALWWVADGSPMVHVRDTAPTTRTAPSNMSRVASAEWLAGYRAFGGPAEYEQRFIESVIPCEGSWQIEPGNPSYIGPMQWHPDSWAKASAGTGLTDRYAWYAHGAATAWWVQRTVPAEQWPTCWWK